MGKSFLNYLRVAIIIAAVGVIVFSLCTDGKAIAKVFVILGMSLLIISMIVSFEKKGVETSSKQALSFPFRIQLLTQILVLSALVFVILDFPYKWVVALVLTLAFISSAFLLFKWKE